MPRGLVARLFAGGFGGQGAGCDTMCLPFAPWIPKEKQCHIMSNLKNLEAQLPSLLMKSYQPINDI